MFGGPLAMDFAFASETPKAASIAGSRPAMKSLKVKGVEMSGMISVRSSRGSDICHRSVEQLAKAPDPGRDCLVASPLWFGADGVGAPY